MHDIELSNPIDQRQGEEFWDSDRQYFIISFVAVAERCHRNAVEHGFWPPEGRNPGEMIALMHSELSEGLEYLRKNPLTRSDHIPDFLGIEEELADVIIRIMDNATKENWRVAEAIIAKMEFNAGRPMKHGKNF